MPRRSEGGGVMRALVLGAAVIAIAVLPAATPARAAVAEPSCASTPLTPEQRAELSDIVFEGTVIDATCQCMQLASGPDDNGAEVECTDTIRAERAIKGQTEAQITIKSTVLLDKDPKKILSHGDCKDKVDDRDGALKGMRETFYLRLADGFYRTVPASACR